MSVNEDRYRCQCWGKRWESWGLLPCGWEQLYWGSSGSEGPWVEQSQVGVWPSALNLFLSLSLQGHSWITCLPGRKFISTVGADRHSTIGVWGRAGGASTLQSPGPLCPNKTDSGSVQACDLSVPTAQGAWRSHPGQALHTALVTTRAPLIPF